MGSESTLCNICETFKDADKFISKQGFKHHSSYKALCDAAASGCSLCQLFKNYPRSRFQDELPPNYEEGMDVIRTQITWKRHSRSMFVLLQVVLVEERVGGLHLWFEVYTEKDDPLATIFPGRPIQTSSTADESFELVSYWMEQCKTEHPLCSENKESTLPTRVVDVGSDSQQPFLYNTKGKKGQWVSLSHCWGNYTPSQTTLATVKQNEISLPLKELQINFQDAIHLTRRLGFQYIWIDALCIIQDSPEDWNHEASQMHQIYFGASLNIAASAAQSGRDGIFSTGNKDRCHMQPLFRLASFSHQSNVGGTLLFRAKAGHIPPLTPISDQPLYQRGWVLQESTLSLRRIDYSSEQLYWFCRTSSLTEGSPQEPRRADWFLSRKELFQMPLGNIAPRPDEPRLRDQTPMSWWYSTLHIYCFRSFTFAEDYLPAVAGIARKVAERTGYTYKAGLWLEDIHRGLLWQPSTAPTPQPRKSKIGPSWTWASTILPWHPRSLHLDIYLPNYQASILAINVQSTTSSDPYGRVLSGSLKLEGNFIPIQTWQVGENVTYNGGIYAGRPATMLLHQRWSKADIIYSKIYAWCKIVAPGHVLCTLDEIDMTDEERGADNFEEEVHRDLVRREVVCVQIAKFGHNLWWDAVEKETGEEMATVFGLLLESVGGEYRRIGIAEIPLEDGLAEGWERGVFTVV